MATAQQLMSDLKHLGNFLQMQKANVSAELWESMVKSHVDTWKHRLDALSSMSPEEATEMAQLVATSPFSDTCKQDISGCLSQKLNELSKKKAKQENQQISEFHHFLSRGDRLVLADASKTSTEKIEQLVSRCVKLGLLWPSEESVGSIISAGVAAGLEADDRHDYYARVTTFKRALHKKRDGIALPVILQSFPDSPAGLPEGINQAAQYDTDPPEPVTREQLQKASTIKTLRKSHSSIAGTKESQSMVPFAGPQSKAGMMSPQNMQESFNMVGRMFMHFMNQGSQQVQQPDINLQFFPQHGSSGSGGRQPQASSQGQPLQLQMPQASSQGQPLQLQKQEASSQGQPLQLQKQEASSQGQPLQLEKQDPPPVSSAAEPLMTVPKPENTPAEHGLGGNDEPSPSEVAKWTQKKPAAVLKPPSAVQAPSQKKAKASSFIPAKKGWQIETRYRADNSTDKYYHAPDKRIFRTRGDAEKQGFRG